MATVPGAVSLVLGAGAGAGGQGALAGVEAARGPGVAREAQGGVTQRGQPGHRGHRPGVQWGVEVRGRVAEHG